MQRVNAQPVQEEGIVIWMYLDGPVEVVFKVRLLLLGLLLRHALSCIQEVEVVLEAVGVVAELTFLPPALLTAMVIVEGILFVSLTERTERTTVTRFVSKPSKKKSRPSMTNNVWKLLKDL